MSTAYILPLHPKLLHHRHRIDLHPVFGNLAVCDSIDDDARHVDLLVRSWDAHEVPFMGFALPLIASR